MNLGEAFGLLARWDTGYQLRDWSAFDVGTTSRSLPDGCRLRRS